MQRCRVTLIHPNQTKEHRIEQAVVRQLTTFRTVVSVPTAEVPDWMDIGGQIVAASDGIVIDSFIVDDIGYVDTRNQWFRELPDWDCNVTTFHPF